MRARVVLIGQFASSELHTMLHLCLAFLLLAAPWYSPDCADTCGVFLDAVIMCDAAQDLFSPMQASVDRNPMRDQLCCTKTYIITWYSITSYAIATGQQRLATAPHEAFLGGFVWNPVASGCWQPRPCRHLRQQPKLSCPPGRRALAGAHLHIPQASTIL